MLLTGQDCPLGTSYPASEMKAVRELAGNTEIIIYTVDKGRLGKNGREVAFIVTSIQPGFGVCGGHRGQ